MNDKQLYQVADAKRAADLARFSKMPHKASLSSDLDCARACLNEALSNGASVHVITALLSVISKLSAGQIRYEEHSDTMVSAAELQVWANNYVQQVCEALRALLSKEDYYRVVDLFTKRLTANPKLLEGPKDES